MNHNKPYFFSLQIRRIAVLLFTCVSSLSKFDATHFFFLRQSYSYFEKQVFEYLFPTHTWCVI
jgi:hypothetical protein